MSTSTLDALNARTDHLVQSAVTVYVSNLGLLEFFSIVISIALFAGIIYIGIKTKWFAVRIDRVRDVVLKTDVPKERAKISWKRVQEHFFKGDENDLKIAVLEADKLLDEAFRGAGIRGSNLGDRLKHVKKNQVSNLDDIWQAHKLRNQIAHEPGFKLRRDLAERALAIYEKTLRDFQILD